MNYIDNNFAWLMNTIKNSNEEEVFDHIRKKYDALSINIKNAIEKFLRDFAYWGKLDYKNNIYEEIKNKAISLYEHRNDYINLYNNLGDYRSKKILFAILYNWYDYDFKYLESVMDKTYAHYFDLDILNCHDEVFVDIGAYTGDSILDFINSYGENSYKKIYAYEMSNDNYQKLLKNTKEYINIDCRKVGVSDKSEVLFLNKGVDNSADNLDTQGNIEVMTTTIDNDIEEKISLIKMDIEGYEEKAIKGCINHIKKDSPKLLISVYHNHEDLWKIPKMLKEINSNYKFYLRYYGGSIFPTEIVLFAIPK